MKRESALEISKVKGVKSLSGFVWAYKEMGGYKRMNKGKEDIKKK